MVYKRSVIITRQIEVIVYRYFGLEAVVVKARKANHCQHFACLWVKCHNCALLYFGKRAFARYRVYAYCLLVDSHSLLQNFVCFFLQIQVEGKVEI